MQPTMRWYQTLAWSYFIRQAAAILGLLAIILWVAYAEAERGARSTAQASLSAGGYVVERAFEQQGRSLDASLEVFTQYSGNLALVEHALESGAATSLTDALAENLLRLGAEIALVAAPGGQVLACTARGRCSAGREHESVCRPLGARGRRAGVAGGWRRAIGGDRRRAGWPGRLCR